MCTVPDLEYHHISDWHLRNFCHIELDPDKEEEPAVLTHGEVCDAVWVQSTWEPPAQRESGKSVAGTDHTAPYYTPSYGKSCYSSSRATKVY